MPPKTAAPASKGPGARAPAESLFVQRPIGIPPIRPFVGPDVKPDNITLAANPSTLYEAIREADIRGLTRELADSSYNPEQTFSATIASPSDANAPGFPITTNLTPLQYAALAGLKGVVRFLLQRTTSDVLKPINKLSVKEAIASYRKADRDKDEIRYIFDLADAAIRDAADDFTSGSDLDKKYGKGLVGKINQDLSNKLYEREYKDLQSPKPLPATAPKSTSALVTDATQMGQDDGERGAPKNPVYDTKPPQEQEAYGKAYDKGYAKYQGEKDGRLNESNDVSKLTGQFSAQYVPGSHKDDVDKAYNTAYEANKGKTADLVKEAGYVGAYPHNEAVLS